MYIKDFYENEELIAITKELADTFRKNRTIDWQKRDSARAKMRMLIKKLLKKHRYPPEGMEDAVQSQGRTSASRTAARSGTLPHRNCAASGTCPVPQRVYIKGEIRPLPKGAP